ncbi:MAG: hypothetical protein AAFU85_25715 [Planctomycetota bacterium]
MLLAPEQSATSIHNDHLLIESDTPREVRDECVLGVSIQATACADKADVLYKTEIFFHEEPLREGAEQQLLHVEHLSSDLEELLRYADRIAQHAALNVSDFVARQGSLQFGEVIFSADGVEFIAGGASHSVEYAGVAAVDSVDGKTLVWRTDELEPFALIEATDPCAAVVRESLRSAVSSATQQTDWIAADSDFSQMVGPIECHLRSLVPSYSALRGLAIGFACVLAAVAWWTVPRYAIYISGLLAAALTAGTVVLTNQAKQSELILAVFRRGLTLMVASGEDVVISWLDITDAKLETQPLDHQDPHRESVHLELTTSAEIGRVIRLEWESHPSNQLALAYLHDQLSRRIWRSADRGKRARR